MADTAVGRRGPGAWPWVAGLIVLALLLWGITRLLNDPAPVAADPVPVAPAAP